MIKVFTSINGETGDVKISIDSNLIGRFFSNLKGLTLNHKDCPPGLKVEKTGNTTALITFPSGINPGILSGQSESGMVGIPTENAMEIQKVTEMVKDFLNQAVKYSIKKTEFIPLYDFTGDSRNYSLSEMQEDVVEALKNKRSLCIIDKFQDYLDNTKSQDYRFNQYLLKYDGESAGEYVDFILMVRSGKIKELREKYSGKLTKTEWF